jgi:hypothetical protein
MGKFKCRSFPSLADMVFRNPQRAGCAKGWNSVSPSNCFKHFVLPSSINIEHSSAVAVMINNLSGLSILELNVITEEAMEQLLTAGLDIKRILVGTFVTSLDGPGFSVTILNLQLGFEDFLNTTTTAPAWPNQIESTGNINGVVERMLQIKTDEEIVGRDDRVLLPGL